MIIKSADNQLFSAGDKTVLKEILHPAHSGLDLPFSIAWAYLEVGQSSKLHRLAESETYYILQGNAEIHSDGKAYLAQKGDCVYLPPMAKQYVTNVGGDRLEFLCIVSPAWTEAGEEILE